MLALRARLYRRQLYAKRRRLSQALDDTPTFAPTEIFYRSEIGKAGARVSPSPGGDRPRDRPAGR
jgi:hypothetical protein